MSDNEFYQERAYIHDYSVEELEIMYHDAKEKERAKEDKECQCGIIIINILGD